ncbi:MAG TPA: 50S ribosomal protein L13 [Spirochaetia bacterium]|nr:50S ribosomal protein L13 [Spirochaetia bacterium]
MKTIRPKVSEIQKKWYVINAKDKVLGRITSKIAALLQGKHKTTFTPNQDCGDFIIVINSDQIKLTGSKQYKKELYRHTGFTGGIKSVTYDRLLTSGKSDYIIKHAVKGMLKHSSLGYKQLDHLKIYRGEQHLHSAQKPEEIKI